jgi:hypothetical protein
VTPYLVRIAVAWESDLDLDSAAHGARMRERAQSTSCQVMKGEKGQRGRVRLGSGGRGGEGREGERIGSQRGKRAFQTHGF